MNTTIAVPVNARIVKATRLRTRRIGIGVKTPLVTNAVAKSVLGVVLTLLLTFSFAVRGFAAPVDVNTADAASLSDSLSGIGPKIAEAIVVYRKENGPFMAIEDLLNVKGIGPRILERNKPDIRLGEQSSSSTSE